jgi:hypothetical protein
VGILWNAGCLPIESRRRYEHGPSSLVLASEAKGNTCTNPVIERVVALRWFKSDFLCRFLGGGIEKHGGFQELVAIPPPMCFSR